MIESHLVLEAGDGNGDDLNICLGTVRNILSEWNSSGHSYILKSSSGSKIIRNALSNDYAKKKREQELCPCWHKLLVITLVCLSASLHFHAYSANEDYSGDI